MMMMGTAAAVEQFFARLPLPPPPLQWRTTRTARRARGGGNVSRPARKTLSVADDLLCQVLKFKIGGGGGGGGGPVVDGRGDRV